MTDAALSHSLLVLLNEALQPTGVWLRRDDIGSSLGVATGRLAFAHNLRDFELSLFANEDGFGELRPCLMLAKSGARNITQYSASASVFEIDLADPAFPEQAAEWVRSALSQS